MNPEEYRIMFHAEDTHWWYRGMHALVTATVTAEKREGRTLRVLDAGCGTGRLCELLSPLADVRGCDRSPLALELSRKRGIEVFEADLNGDDLGTSAYDVITSIDVLYHRDVHRQERALANFFAALRPGGLLVLHLPAFEFLRSAHDVAVHTGRRYTRSEVTALVRQAGFVVEKSTYRLCLLLPLVALFRLVRRMTTSGMAPATVPSDVRMPPTALNALLTAALRLENGIVRRWSLPWGTSVFVLARKPDTGAKE